jgi:uncharacterized protein (UPF0297 family)
MIKDVLKAEYNKRKKTEIETVFKQVYEKQLKELGYVKIESIHRETAVVTGYCYSTVRFVLKGYFKHNKNR